MQSLSVSRLFNHADRHFLELVRVAEQRGSILIPTVRAATLSLLRSSSEDHEAG